MTDTENSDKQHCPDCDELVETEVHEFGGREQLYCSDCGRRIGYA